PAPQLHAGVGLRDGPRVAGRVEHRARPPRAHPKRLTRARARTPSDFRPSPAPSPPSAPPIRSSRYSGGGLATDGRCPDRGSIPILVTRRCSDAEQDRSHRLLRCSARHAPAGGGCEVEDPLTRPTIRGGVTVKLKRILYSLGWLAALAIAVS